MDSSLLDSLSKLGIGAALGGAIAAAAATRVARYNNDRQDAKERSRRKEELLIQPIVRFVDDVLQYLSDLHWTRVDGDAAAGGDRLKEFRVREGVVRSRLAALNNPDITTLFNDFEKAGTVYRANLADNGPFAAYKPLTDVHVAGGRLLAALFTQVEASPPGA